MRRTKTGFTSPTSRRGMGLYNAVAHALTTMPTGGFSSEARSVEPFAPVV